MMTSFFFFTNSKSIPVDGMRITLFKCYASTRIGFEYRATRLLYNHILNFVAR